ncbi:MAG TPA: chromate transporter [Lachnospiraceae bacterium]|nr:chromate transporter [Lachnospiraceae bacterium]
MKELFDLYYAFLRIGLVNFGGGYAMLPLLERDLAEKRGWVTVDELMDYFAIGQCTPGLIALNVATFIGNKRKGVIGGIVATLGFLTCPIVIILLIAMFLTNFADLPIVKNAFAGIRVCVCVLILQAILKLWGKSVIDRTTLVIYLIIFLLMVFSDLLPVSVPAFTMVIAAAVFGVFFGKEGNRK